jgi:[ribosomal protein S5]-alanine N-acetyltransferase
MFHDPRVFRYLPFARRIETGREIVKRARQGVRSGSAYRFVVRTKGFDHFVGSSILFDLDPRKRSAELGYAFAKQQWGHGYATESCVVLLRWAFNSLRLRRIAAVVASENTASIRVLRKLGFRLEGRRREAGRRNGRWADDLEYGLLRREFRDDSI